MSSNTGSRFGRSAHDQGAQDGPSVGSPQVAIPDETIAAFIMSPRFAQTMGDRWGRNWAFTRLSTGAANLTWSANDTWQDVHALANSGDPITITPKSSGVMAFIAVMSLYCPTGHSSRSNFRVNGDLVYDNSNGLSYASAGGGDLWAPTTIFWMDQYPIGEQLAIHVNVRATGGGTAQMLGNLGLSIMAAVEVF